jgi:hypothetical protein
MGYLGDCTVLIGALNAPSVGKGLEPARTPKGCMPHIPHGGTVSTDAPNRLERTYDYTFS